jgi:hypothetical protein
LETMGPDAPPTKALEPLERHREWAARRATARGRFTPKNVEDVHPSAIAKCVSRVASPSNAGAYAERISEAVGISGYLTS